MIGITVYRVAIGTWCNVMKSNPLTLSDVNGEAFDGIDPRIVFLIMLDLSLCGDIHSNPGPLCDKSKQLSMCHINARSLLSNGPLDSPLYSKLDEI